MAIDPSSHDLRSPLDKFLGIFAKIQPKEGLSSLVLLTNIALILIAYYLIKPVREGWLSVSIITGLSKLEVKAYSAFGQSILLLAILPLYSYLARRWSRRVLITRTGIFSGCMLFIFWCIQPGFLVSQVPFAGVLFYIFVGLFSVTLVAQFWSFASDIYGLEKGKRLFPLIAVGASAGAMIGSFIGEQLIRFADVEAFDLILIALIPLTMAIYLARWTDKAEQTQLNSSYDAIRSIQPAAPEDGGPFGTIFKHHYLTAMALMVMIFNWIVASGDNILYGMVQQILEQQLSTHIYSTPADFSKALKAATTIFYSELYFWVNLCGLLLQAFVVSRLLHLGGFGLLVLTTPVVSLVAYVSMSVAPILGVIKVMKIAESSSNYSINNTARHMLWLPTSKSMLYQAKTTVDTLFVRMGDGLAALTVLLGSRVWHLKLSYFLYFNVVLVLIWIALAFFLFLEHKKWSNDSAKTNDHAK